MAREPEERRVWAAMVLDGGGDMLDIGANTATYAISAKAMAPDAHVFAFEPVKRIADLARENIQSSGLDISVLCAALAREKGELPIYDPGGDNAYSASLDPAFLDGDKDSYLVPVMSVDEFCSENGLAPTAIKLDVEGYEGEVLCGAGEVLKRGDCAIICEWMGTSPAHIEARDLLDESGYIALDIHDFSEVDLASRTRDGDRNVLLVHHSRADHLKAALRKHM